MALMRELEGLSRPRALLRRGARFRRLGAALAVAALLSVTPFSGHSELRPLVREMLEQLGAVQSIGQGLALEDFGRIRRSAEDLQARARELRKFDVSALGVDPSLQPQFNSYLHAQEQGAAAIARAGEQEDAPRVLDALQKTLNGSCLACHREFRARQDLLRPSVLFMTTFLDAWKGMMRGLLTDDFTLVTREARELQAMVRVVGFDQVIETTFGLTDAEQRKEFRRFLQRLSRQAARVEQAAYEEDGGALTAAARAMWEQGCLACHQRFRRGVAEPSSAGD